MMNRNTLHLRSLRVHCCKVLVGLVFNIVGRSVCFGVFFWVCVFFFSFSPGDVQILCTEAHLRLANVFLADAHKDHITFCPWVPLRG